jgi:hypothetical protein
VSELFSDFRLALSTNMVASALRARLIGKATSITPSSTVT